MAELSAVLLDTDVWSVLFSRIGNKDPRCDHWRRPLVGRELAIATQSRAEGLVDTYAQLTADLAQSGHALHQKLHTGDRWVAATAVHHQLPLLSGDRIFRDVPDLDLLDYR